MPAQTFNPGSPSLSPLISTGSEIQNSFNIPQQQMTLRDLLSQQQLRQAQTQNISLEAQQRQRDLNDAQTIQKTLPGILNANNGKFDADQVRSGLTQAGVNLKTIEDVIGSHVGNDEKVAQTGELNAAARKAQLDADNLQRQRDEHVREQGGAAADAIAQANYSVPVTESILSTYEANDPTYKASGQGDKLRQLAATDPAAFKQQIDAIRNNPDYLNAKAGREKTIAEGKESSARAEYLSEQALAEKAARESADTFLKDPTLVLGKGGQIDKLPIPDKQKDLLRGEVQALMATPGMTPVQRAAKVSDAISNAVKAETELQRQTDPRMLNFDANKARSNAKASALGQMDAVDAGGPGGGSTAQMIAEYKIAPPSARSMVTPAGQAMMAAVRTLNPEYDATKYQQRQKARVDYTTGQQGQQAIQLNTMIGHVDDALDAAAAMGNKTFTPYNEVANKVKNAFGSDSVTNFDTFKMAVAGETAKVLKGVATDSEVESVKKNISSASSPAQLQTALKDTLRIAGSKLRGLEYNYSQAFPEDKSFSILSPESKQTLVKRGFDPATMRPAAPAAPAVGTVKDGYTFKGGDPSKKENWVK